MKTNKLATLRFSLFFLFLLAGVNVAAQTEYELGPAAELNIIGKSTIRVWKMSSKEAQGGGIFVVENGMLVDVLQAKVAMRAMSLTSGNKGLDRHAYEALKADRYEDLVFHLTDFLTEGDAKVVSGDLTIANVTKPVRFPVEVSQIEGLLHIRGKLPIKFSDFEIETPTNLFGLIKTHDDATITFDATFQPSIKP